MHRTNRFVARAIPAASPVPARGPACLLIAAALIIALLFAVPAAFAQSGIITDRDGSEIVAAYTPVDTIPDAAWRSAERVRPAAFQAIRVDLESLRAGLVGTPLEGSPRAGLNAGKTLELPHPAGIPTRFTLTEAPVLAPELQAKYPQIRTYIGRAIDDPSVVARISVTPKGLHAQVFDHGGTWYIDPFSMDDNSLHTTYWRKELAVKHAFSCMTLGEAIDPDQLGMLDPQATASETPRGISGQLRTYRLAVTTTGEYSQFHGGTVPGVLAEIVVAINRVTGIYEVDLGIRFQLVPRNDELIFLNAGSDPFSNGSAFSLISENPGVINGIIGLGAYDVGHNFSTGGGGLASLRVVCTNDKARGITGLGSPVGDPFYVDYVAHEIGHQFGGNHTFNGVSGSCSGGNRNGSTAYEPGSGTTIMAYAGICGGDNIQPNSDPYFHSISLDEINAFAFGAGGSCAVITNTGNQAPTVSAGPNFAIPAETPFSLTAIASDPESNTLTYSWEQRDLGPSQALSSADNGSSPLFIARPTTTDPTRFFPRFADVLSGASNPREELPSLSRAMDFRVVVRDGNGGVASDDVVLNVVGGAGPFRVTSPAQGSIASGLETVLWDVAGTNAGAINAQSVNIRLSLDNGQTFPAMLAESVPNTGSAVVELPAVNTNGARILIEAADNVFYNITRNFTIEPAALLIALVNPPQALDPGVATPIEVRIAAVSQPIDPVTATLFVSVDGGPFQPRPLALVSGDMWTGTLPPVLCGSSVSYYASAQTTTGIGDTSPGEGPADPIDADVGSIETVFADSFAANTGWTVSGNAADGQWTRGVPVGGGDRSDPATGFDADGFCWLTDNVDGNSDVDDGATILTSPIINLDGGGTISYAYWLDDSAGAGLDGADGLRVETSNNGGASWRTEILYTSAAQAWRTDTRTIPAGFAGPNFRVRFTVSDQGAGSLVEGGLDAFSADANACENPPPCPADVAAAFGTLDVNDVIEFVNAFNTSNPLADISPPGGDGQINVNDVIEFVNAFNAGCP